MSLIRCLRGAFALAVVSTLAACGGGGGGGGSGGDPNPPGPTTFTVAGTVTGLAGSGLALQNNGGNTLAISANGQFTFTTALTNGAAYQVTVSAQPVNPGQTCSVANGSGTSSANVTNVTVSCTTNTHTLSGTVSGLSGSGLILQNNGGNNLAISSNGAFSFPTAVVSGSSYAITVASQPSGPAQTCTVANGSGTVSANVTNVTVTCTTNTHTLSGTVSGLSGSGLVLQNNGGSDLAITKNGAFSFPSLVASGSNYAITVASQPSGPAQTCTVANGSGTVGANVTDITITCSTTTFFLAGSVNGLAGTGLVLHSNSGEDVSISANGAFVFPTALAGGMAYQVTVATQPTNPGQTCTIANGSGVITNNVANVAVTCSTNTHTISGTVSGLSGTGLVLQNDGASLPVTGNGAFAFPATVLSGSSYNITVATQPTGPSQTCTVANGSGTITGNVTNVSVTCSTHTFTLGGTVTGLTGSGLVLRNGAGEDVSVNTNGAFTFATAIADSTAYNVTVLTQPSTPTQQCTVTNGSGTITANVSNVTVSCTNPHTIGGSVSGLAGTGLVLQNNSGDNLAIAANGAFTFATAIDSGSPYSVTVLTQPANVTQTCVVGSGSGTVAAADITNVSVTCTTNSYAIGGTVSSGLGAGTGLVISDSTGEQLTLNANGSFEFTNEVDSGQAFSITIDAAPTNPTRRCTIAGDAAGIVTNADISVTISCATSSPTFAYALNNGDDRFATYAIDAASGQLRIRSFVQTGTNPRTAVTYKAQNGNQFSYVVNRDSNDVSGYSVNKRTGVLTEVAGSPYLTLGTAPETLYLHPTRPFLYVPNTGGSSIAAFSINETTGALTAIAGSPVPTSGALPRRFAIEPVGRFAYVATDGNNRLCGYTINQSTGALTAIPGSCVATTGAIAGGIGLEKHGHFLYVVNPNLAGNSTIDAYSIDAATGVLTAVAGSPFTVGSHATFGAIHPNGKFMYVKHVGATPAIGFSVWAIDAATGALTAAGTFDPTAYPSKLAFDPTGKFLYATSANFTPVESSVRAYEVNTTTGALTALTPHTVNILASSLSVDASGKYLYVTSDLADQIASYSIDPGTGELTVLTQSPANIGALPNFIEVDNDDDALTFQSKYVYVGGAQDGLLYPFSLDDTTGHLTPVSPPVMVGGDAYSVVVHPNNRFMYSTSAFSNLVWGQTIGASGELTYIALTGTFHTGSLPTGLAIEPSGRFLYVTNYGDGTVQSFAIEQSSGALTSLGTVTGLPNMDGAVAHPNGHYVYALASVATPPSRVLSFEIDLSTGTLTSTGGANAPTTTVAGLAVEPSGKYAYVTDSDGDQVLLYYVVGNTLSAGAPQPLPAGAESPRGITVHPSGKFLFTANYDTNNVSVFAIASDGTLSSVGSYVVGSGPSTLIVDSSGRYLVVTHDLDNTVRTYSIDPSTGALQSQVDSDSVPIGGVVPTSLAVSSHTQ